MQYAAGLTILFLTLSTLELPVKLAILSSELVKDCSSLLPSSRFFELSAAIVCGRSPSSIPKQLQEGGLVHLIVVSGAHLIFLENILRTLGRNRLPSWAVGLLLAGYTITTGLQPPCLRSLIQWSLGRWVRRAGWNWHRFQTVAFSGILTLFLFPEWLTSLSFLLSWSCGFVLSLNFANSWSRQTALYLFLIPILGSLAIAHPLSIPLNLILGPVLGGWLFPICLLSFFGAPFSYLADLSWSALLRVLGELPLQLVEPIGTPMAMGWIVLVLGQAAAQLVTHWKGRYE